MTCIIFFVHGNQKNLLCFTEGQSYTFGSELVWINADRFLFDLPSVQVCSLLLYVAKDIITASYILLQCDRLPFHLYKPTCIVFLCLLSCVCECVCWLLILHWVSLNKLASLFCFERRQGVQRVQTECFLYAGSMLMWFARLRGTKEQCCLIRIYSIIPSPEAWSVWNERVNVWLWASGRVKDLKMYKGALRSQGFHGNLQFLVLGTGRWATAAFPSLSHMHALAAQHMVKTV